MQVACGQCSTRFAVPDDKVRGRHVQIVCGKCGAVIKISIPPPPAASRDPLDTIPTTPEELARLVRLGASDSQSDTHPDPLSAGLLTSAPSPLPPSAQQRPGRTDGVSSPTPVLAPRVAPQASPARPQASPALPQASAPEIELEQPGSPDTSGGSSAMWWLGIPALLAALLVAAMAANLVSASEVVGFSRKLLQRVMR